MSCVYSFHLYSNKLILINRMYPRIVKTRKRFPPPTSFFRLRILSYSKRVTHSFSQLLSAIHRSSASFFRSIRPFRIRESSMPFVSRNPSLLTPSSPLPLFYVVAHPRKPVKIQQKHPICSCVSCKKQKIPKNPLVFVRSLGLFRPLYSVLPSFLPISFVLCGYSSSSSCMYVN